MKLYTSPAETEVLLSAVHLLRLEANNRDVEHTCDKLIARIERCKTLQHPDCDKNNPRGHAPRGNDVKCIDCEYLELSLPYGVCSRDYGMVYPDDSCGKGKPRKEGEGNNHD